MSEPFDPANHRFGPSRYFEDFKLGEVFYIPSRTATEAQFLAFQAASGDNHPIHYDIEFCRAHGDHSGVAARLSRPRKPPWRGSRIPTTDSCRHVRNDERAFVFDAAAQSVLDHRDRGLIGGTGLVGMFGEVLLGGTD